jgi:cytochrome c biogenesis protein CcmG/thiol:disulfide interchange protein DsbE
MKKIVTAIPLLIFLVVAIFLYKGLSLEKDVIPSALVGKSFPVFSLPNLEGDSILTKKQIVGPALVNIWATWCPSCYDEHTYLNTLSSSGVVIYGINYKDEDKAALDWLKHMRNPYKLIISDKDGRLGIDLGVYGAPETFIIDKNGSIVFRYVGPIDENVWDTKIKKIYNKLDK